MRMTKPAFANTNSPSQASIASALNKVLRNELTGINQYFLHARMLKKMGFMKLADFEYKESIDEMKHADMLVERLLFIGAAPALEDLNRLRIGDNVLAILQNDLALEEEARGDLSAAITACRNAGDHSSADILQRILDSEEVHIGFIRTQLNLIDTMGLSAYLQTQV
jgi:bacterioferritin